MNMQLNPSLQLNDDFTHMSLTNKKSEDELVPERVEAPED